MAWDVTTEPGIHQELDRRDAFVRESVEPLDRSSTAQVRRHAAARHLLGETVHAPFPDAMARAAFGPVLVGSEVPDGVMGEIVGYFEAIAGANR